MWHLRRPQAEFVHSRTIDSEFTAHAPAFVEVRLGDQAVEPVPSIRVFGFFAEKDAFVATHHELRGTLGRFESNEWLFAKTFARSQWKKLFDLLLPRAETDATELVTGALNEKYFKS